MNYIILDMEWDSAYFKKSKGFINQIIQIGAVKLDSQFNIIDTFEKTINSSISKKLTGRFSRLTGITNDMMRAGIPLKDAVLCYNDWIGDDTVTMTWSNSDLYCMLENEQNLLDGVKFKLQKYLDLQSFVQNELRLQGAEITSQISLSTAAEKLGIETEGLDFHTAKDDCIACAKLLEKCYNKKRFEALIKDTENPEFYKKLFFKPYYISDISDKNINRSDLKFFCEECGQKARRKTNFKYRNRWFCASFYCKNCGNEFSGRVCFRKTYDSVIVKKKICEIKALKEKKADDMQPLSEKM